MMNYYNHYLGKPDYLAQDIARLRGVSAGEIQRFAQRLQPNARVVLHALPGKQQLEDGAGTAVAPTGTATESVNQDEPWRNQAPRPAAEALLQLPAPKVAQMPNGLTIILVERRGLPLVSARLVLRTGGDSDAVEKPGVADFTAAMLDQGTATRSAPQLAKELARLGATLSTESTMDDTSVGVRSLKRNVSDVMHLLADVVLHPAFPNEEIARQKAGRLAELVQRRTESSVMADDAFSAVLYGPKHPYGFPAMGTEVSIRATERDDLMGFWKQNIVPNNAALVVAGEITMDELQALAEKEFGGWPRGVPVRPELASPPEPKHRAFIVDKPGAAQTQLRVGRIGAPRSTADYAALEVMNTALGGAFSSRINLNLREDKGYTYGANSRFSYRREAGPFWVRTGVRTDVTAPAVSEILKEIRGIAEKPLSDDELALAKDGQIRSLPGRFETTQQLVSSFASVFTYDLGADYYTRLPGMLSAVDGAAVEAVVKKYLAPDQMVVVAVGDRARIEAPLNKVGLGTFQILTVDGAEVP
jgi:zinc protease